MGKVSTKEINKGYREAMEEMQKVKRGPHVKVGTQGATGSRKHPEGEGATITDIATYNEFGTKTIPERSFIRSTMDDERENLLKMNRKLFFLMAAGKITTARALKILGLVIQSKIKAKITNLREPPNAPRTIAKKGSSNPLIDTGTLRNSITFKVIHGGGDTNDEGSNTTRGGRRRRRSPAAQRRAIKRGFKRNTKRVKRTVKRTAKSAKKSFKRAKRKTISKAKKVRKSAQKSINRVKRKATRAQQRRFDRQQKELRKKTNAEARRLIKSVGGLRRSKKK